MGATVGALAAGEPRIDVTRWPTLRSVTLSPTSAMTPAASRPTLAGKGGSWFHSVPLKIAFMLGMTPHDLTWTSTSSGRGFGRGTLSIRRG